jgi:elongation factor P hydroxylase
MTMQLARAEISDISADCETLITLFDRCFAESTNTRLVRGDGEPVYLPADADCPYHRVIFAHGFFASALHEIAHWCVAGEARRLQVDYGYWYAPDGRDELQQREFEQVEVKPQALEWIFTRATLRRFRLSVDNLNGVETDPAEFRRAVHERVLTLCEQGLNPRAEKFRQILVKYFGSAEKLSADDFQYAELERFGG